MTMSYGYIQTGTPHTLQEEVPKKKANLLTGFLRSDEEFGSLQGEWDNLVARNRSTSIFLTWEWLYSWWNHFGGNQDLRIVTIRNEAGRLLGIGPFSIRNYGGFLHGKVLGFLGTAPLSSEYLDIIADRDYEEEVVNAVFHFLSNDRSSWDYMLFSDLLETSLILNCLKRLFETNGFATFQSTCQICPYLDLPVRKDEFYKGLGSSTRNLLKRRTKKFFNEGGEFRVVERKEELSHALDVLFDLHRKRWTGRGGNGSFNDSRIRAFHRDVAGRFFDDGRLRFYTLRHGGTDIAALYTFQHCGKIFYFQAGFDPDMGQYSPGLVLMGQGIEDAISRGVKEFDYLRGPETYKWHWTKTFRETWALTIIPRGNLRAIWWVRLNRVLKRLKSAIKGYIVKFRGKEEIY